MPELQGAGDRIDTFRRARIFQAIFALEAGGGTLDFEEVHARLEEADQDLLAQAVLERRCGRFREEEFAAAMASVRRVGRRSTGARQLKARIKERERAGNWNEALRLTAELQALERAARRAARMTASCDCIMCDAPWCTMIWIILRWE